MKTLNILCTLLCTMLLATLPATAQNTNDNKNKAIIETKDGNRELNTDDIQRIRFDGGKITVVHSNGETTFDRTLRTLSFRRSNPGTLRLTATTSIGTEGSGNRAQAIDGEGKLKATWEDGDQVYVYADASTTSSIGTLTPKSEDWGKSTATLTGDIDASELQNGETTLYFSTQPRPFNFSSQDGTAESLFYFIASAEVTIDGGNATVSGLDFRRPFAVVKFTLKDKATGNPAINATQLTVNDGTNTYTVTPAARTNELFVGIPGISSKTVTLTATDGPSSYTYEKTGVTFEDNLYYAINVKMTNTTDYLTVPLTFEAKTAGTIAISSPKSGMQYTLNGGAKTAVPSSITVAAGDIVQFYGNGTSITSYDGTGITGGTADCYIYGNIMSLVDEVNYATATSLTNTWTFSYLFNNNRKIYNHASKELKLPATTLSDNCYRSMFLGCTNLTTAPALPAKILPGYCYYLMFGNCTNLTNAPELPATTLAENCYHSMFQECTSLTTAPELPATTLATSCYSQMFYLCTGLITAPELPATTLASFCYQYMFLGCTSLTTAPTLPATTLASYCYNRMFSGCSNLNSVTCLATDISATNCTTDWLNGVAATGTFNKTPSMTSWTTGASGIPSGWTTYSIGALPGQFTVNAGGGKVYFSQGNLQYQASTGTWRFAPNQYDMIGSDNANISDSYTGWIDLFGWGTGDAPTKSSTNNSDYSTFTDWGTNAISNGGNTANMWSTLTVGEWGYLLEHHTKGWSTVNGVNGYVIRPDGVSTAVASSYTASEWAVEEAAGSVFLPAACSRGGTSFNAGSWGDYWSSTPSNSDDAYYLYFHSGGQNPANSACRWGGRSVRLVYETPYFQGSGTEADPYLISSEADWNYLAVKVNSGTSYASKFFRQTADIDVTTMVGNSSTSRPFSGTYDGDGKKLNVSLNTTEPHTAPFRFIADATIKNVVTTGSVHSTSNHPAGLVGETDGTCTLRNCLVGANVGGAQHSGGIVGHCWHANISIIGCVYSGTLTPASGQYTGGIIGWGGDGGGHTMTISNCLFAGSVNGSTSFHPVGIVQNTNNNRTVSNTYYTVAHNLSNENTHGNSFVNGLSYKGKFARSITAGTDVTVANAGEATEYNVSGITSYGTGILYGGVLYAGNGEAVSLTLSHGEAPTGFTFTQYTVSGDGTLANPTTNSPTLTMSDADQTINVEWSFSQTFNYMGDAQTFTVPATGYYTLECYGAQGGAFTSNRGGYGGTSQLTYQLTQGDILYFYVGGQGGSIAEERDHAEGGNGGWNGGGKGGTGVKHRNVESETPWSGGGGGGGATHIATSAIGAITSSTDFTSNHTNLLLIAGGGGGGCNKGIGGKGGGATGEKGFHIDNSYIWSIDWNNGTCSCGKDGMLSSWEDHSCEGCGGGGGGYVGGNTWVVQYNEPHQCYSGAGGSSWGETTNGKAYSTTTGGATAGGNGKAVITWYGTTYPTN